MTKLNLDINIHGIDLQPLCEEYFRRLQKKIMVRLTTQRDLVLL